VGGWVGEFGRVESGSLCGAGPRLLLVQRSASGPHHWMPPSRQPAARPQPPSRRLGSVGHCSCSTQELQQGRQPWHRLRSRSARLAASAAVSHPHHHRTARRQRASSPRPSTSSTVRTVRTARPSIDAARWRLHRPSTSPPTTTARYSTARRPIQPCHHLQQLRRRTDGKTQV